MERYRFRKMKWVLGLLVLGSCLKLSAQSPSASSDSISVFTLMEQVEKKTSCKIYTDISKPFLVKKQIGDVSLEQLEQALDGTGWKVNIHGKRVFVMRNLELQTNLPKSWREETHEQQQTISIKSDSTICVNSSQALAINATNLNNGLSPIIILFLDKIV